MNVNLAWLAALEFVVMCYSALYDDGCRVSGVIF